MSHPSPRSSRSAYLLLVLTMLLWSTNFVIARAIHGQIGPFGLAFGRWAIALLCLLPFGLPRLARAWPLLRQQWQKLLLLGVFGIGLTNTLVYVAVRSTTATNAVILNSATPMMVLVLGSLYFRQRLSRRQWAGMGLALAGALLIVLKGNLLGMSHFQFSSGDLLVLAAGLCWAVYTLGLRTLRPGLDPLVMMMVLLLVGEVLLLPAFVEETWQAGGFHLLSGPVMGCLLYLGIFPSVLAFLMYNRAIAQVGAAKAAAFLYLMPAFGALQSILLLGEDLRWYHVAGLAAIFSGIVLGSLSRGTVAATARRSTELSAAK
ncbi:DMT family transporter [Aquitalea palustris]|uniref:DMT family transporter n=1 Tax=Aquitalea palustris TaxID=2480983 RepID=A0A454JH28_9NEIS|nr:DMT family transporter [Aquitalea palustris]RMC96180.1 DMT family transporter [Aquitalea palustris]